MARISYLKALWMVASPDSLLVHNFFLWTSHNGKPSFWSPSTTYITDWNDYTPLKNWTDDKGTPESVSSI